jgi:predicted metal-dependent peptidase
MKSTDGGGVMNKSLSVEEKLSRARTQLLLNQPFFGTLCLRLKLLSLSGFPTMATDGCRLVYNPAFVETLTPAELEGVLAHEVMHCALAHHCRRGARNPQLWNLAADYAINPILIGNGITLPKDALVNPSFANLGAEEIYARLLKQGEDPSQSQTPQQFTAPTGAGVSHNSPGQSLPNTPKEALQPVQQPVGQQSQLPGVADHLVEARAGGFGEVLDAVGEDDQPASPAELSRQTHEWAINAEQALRSAKACGREPGGIERPLEQVRQSEHDWRAILRDFIAATNLSDYRWAPPNRRFVASGLYLPSIERSGVGEIVIVVDTSGSIGAQELEQFAGEITAISHEGQPDSIHVIYCDAAVQGVEEFGPSEPIKLSPKGGGGTDFVPPFNWVEENGMLPKCLIYLTDLCCSSFPGPPDYPVLWVTDSHKRAPFGETLRI